MKLIFHVPILSVEHEHLENFMWGLWEFFSLFATNLESGLGDSLSYLKNINISWLLSLLVFVILLGFFFCGGGVYLFLMTFHPSNCSRLWSIYKIIIRNAVVATRSYLLLYKNPIKF